MRRTNRMENKAARCMIALAVVKDTCNDVNLLRPINMGMDAREKVADKGKLQ